MLHQLALRDFRNFESLDVALPDSGLAIVGENGHGKTNLLEAISYLGLFRSFRGARDADVIRFGAPAFHVRARLTSPASFNTVSVGFERATRRKRAALDGVEQSRLSLAFGALPSVCFAPADVVLVAGGPVERRRFLDVALSLSTVGYLPALQKYRSALAQRNSALRSAPKNSSRASSSALEANVSVWEPALAEFGGALAAMRSTWCEQHAAQFGTMCQAIGERQNVALRYASAKIDSAKIESDSEDFRTSDSAASRDAADFSQAYLKAFDAQRTNEMRRGVTLVGPHRDDLRIALGTRAMRNFGSAGQQRTAAIALRMLEFASVRESIGVPPMLLLDDPFAELDANRSARILALLQELGVGQTVLTVPRDEDIPREFTRLERRAMSNGVLV